MLIEIESVLCPWLLGAAWIAWDLRRSNVPFLRRLVTGQT